MAGWSHLRSGEQLNVLVGKMEVSSSQGTFDGFYLGDFRCVGRVAGNLFYPYNCEADGTWL